MHTATLSFTVERANLSAAALQAAMQAVPLPLDALVGLGVYVLTDTYSTTMLGSNPAGVRTLQLVLDFGVAAGLSLTADGNNAVSAVNVVGSGSEYGGQPIVSYPLAFFPQIVTDAGSTPVIPLPGEGSVDQSRIPQFLADMKMDTPVVPLGGANYTAPVVTFSGPTMRGGVQATGHASVLGGVIENIVIDNAGSGYCTAPVIRITDSTGSGAYAMATLQFNKVTVTSPGSIVTPAMAALTVATPVNPPALYTSAIAPTSAARAAVLRDLLAPSFRSALKFPVIAAAPIIT